MTTTFTLSELHQFEKNTAKVSKQFPVSQTRVNAIKRSYEDTETFFGCFSVAANRDDGEYYLVGGRHRLQAFTELGDPISDYPAFVQELASVQELIKAIEIDNGSRSMTGSEKDYLGYTFDSLGESDYKVDDAKRLRTAYLHYKISSGGCCTQETTKKIWSSVIRNLTKDERSILVTNEPALAKFVETFQDALVVSLRNVTNPARNYKPVAEKVLNESRPCLSSFSKVVIQKTRLTKADKAGVAACGKALIESLEADDFVPEISDNVEGRVNKEGVPFAHLVSVNIPASELTDIEF
jgi:hypothetical protein